MCVCGRKNCNGFCKINTGYKMISFLDGIVLKSTNIGEMEEDSSEGKYLTCVGNQYFKDDETGKLLKDYTKYPGIIKENVFNIASEIKECLEAYGNAHHIDVTKYIKMVRGLSDYKQVIIPFEICGRAKILEDGNKRECKISYIKWLVEDDSYIHCKVAVKTYDRKTTVKDLESFGESLTVSSIILEDAPEEVLKAIKMNKFGYMQPIIIQTEDESERIIIDNKSIYYVHNNILKSIENDTELKNEIKNAKLKRFVNKSLLHIRLSRTKMCPYGIGHATTVNV